MAMQVERVDLVKLLLARGADRQRTRDTSAPVARLSRSVNRSITRSARPRSSASETSVTKRAVKAMSPRSGEFTPDSVMDGPGKCERPNECHLAAVSRRTHYPRRRMGSLIESQ